MEEGFDSRRLIEKGPGGKCALPSPSRENPMNGAYRHNPSRGKSNRRKD